MPVLLLSSFSSIFLTSLFLLFLPATEQKRSTLCTWALVGVSSIGFYLWISIISFLKSKSVMKLQDMEYIINFVGIELQMNLHQDAYHRLYEWLKQSSSERKPLPFLEYCIEKSWTIIQIYLVWYTLSGLSSGISFVNQCLVSKAKSMINSYKSFNFISVNTFLYLAYLEF